MIYFNGYEIASTYRDILNELWFNPEYIASPRGKEVREIRDCTIEVLNPLVNLYYNKHRSSPEHYIAAEILWYLSGTNNPTYIENYAKLWKNIHNTDGTVNSAYGNLLFHEVNDHGLTQYEWVIETLKKDKDSRQAFMHFNKPDHQWFGNKDQVCTLQSLFHIRDNELHMTLTMRSNDVIYGFMTDWAFFSILQYHVYLHLKKYYPRLKMGTYTHISHSMHLYEKHYKLVEKILNSEEKFSHGIIPLMNETILTENGSIKEKYKKFLNPILIGEKPNYSQKTGNDLLDWCFEKLNEQENI